MEAQNQIPVLQSEGGLQNQGSGIIELSTVTPQDVDNTNFNKVTTNFPDFGLSNPTIELEPDPNVKAAKPESDFTTFPASAAEAAAVTFPVDFG